MKDHQGGLGQDSTSRRGECVARAMILENWRDVCERFFLKGFLNPCTFVGEDASFYRSRENL